MGAGATFPDVALPVAIGRRMRLGPFPSARDALRFLAYATAGAVVIPFFGAIAWLPFLGAGFLLTVVPIDGTPLDLELARRVSHWHRSTIPIESPMTPIRRSRGAVVEVGTGAEVAVLRCRGKPIAFLPPEQLRQRFDAFRELLRSTDGGIVLATAGVPVDPTPFRPTIPHGEDGETRAARAYSEMVGLLCRRRSQRRIYVLQWDATALTGGTSRLEHRLGELAARLGHLGVEPERLAGRELTGALHRFGFANATRGPG